MTPTKVVDKNTHEIRYYEDGSFHTVRKSDGMTLVYRNPQPFRSK